MWPLTLSGVNGHDHLVIIMAKLTYKGNDKSRELIKRKTIASGECIDFNPIHALAYLGDEQFIISFEVSDREVLKNCGSKQLTQLEQEFGGEGIYQVLENMFPKSKKLISKVAIPTITKKSSKKDVKKSIVKTPSIKKETTIKSTKKGNFEKKISES
jgi:hypothetical protein